MKQTEIENNFTYHKPELSDLEKYARIRNMGKQYCELINELCPDSREKSLSITNIEQSNMWANASIARS